MPSSLGRIGTAIGDGAAPRPMTAMRGAGYTSHGSKGPFDPLNQGTRSPAQLETKLEEGFVPSGSLPP